MSNHHGTLPLDEKSTMPARLLLAQGKGGLGRNGSKARRVWGPGRRRLG